MRDNEQIAMDLTKALIAGGHVTGWRAACEAFTNISEAALQTTQVSNDPKAMAEVAQRYRQGK